MKKNKYLTNIFIFVKFAFVLYCATLIAKDLNNQYSIKKNNASFIQKSYHGKYLAAYYAAKENDIENSAIKFDSLLKEKSQYTKFFAENAILMHMVIGNVSRAIEISEMKSNPIDFMLLSVDALKNKDHKKASDLNKLLINEYKSEETNLIVRLFDAWIQAIDLDFEESLQSIYFLKHNDSESRLLIMLQEAVIADLANKTELAENAYCELVKFNQSFVVVSLAANFYQRIGKLEEANKLYTDFNNSNPLKQIFRDKLNFAQQTPESTERIIKNPTQGLFFFILELSSMLLENNNINAALIYARMIEYIDPTSEFANLALAQYYNCLKHYQYALEYYKKIPNNSFLYDDIESNIAQLLYLSDKKKEADELFNNIIKQNPQNIESLLIYANILTTDKDFTKSISIYDYLIEKGSAAKDEWYLYYMRGSNHYLNHNFVESENDLKKSLELNPQNPTIMNDLAYNWICNKKDLEQALSIAQRASESSPDNPQFIDTLAWGFYMQENYTEARKYIDKAILLITDLSNQKQEYLDPDIYDHSGDIYWKLGKKTLARFSWQYAIEETTEKELKSKIKQKIINSYKKPISF